MAEDQVRHHGLWDLAVLCLLRERSMHPYEMQSLLRERHKDEVLVLKRGSLYHAIDRLQKSQLIEAIETARNGRRPERTTYRITSTGERQLIRWLEEYVAMPRREPSEFMTAVSFLLHLSPGEAAAQLERRANRLERQVADFEEGLRVNGPRVGRVNLLESEYALAMIRAELEWVRGLITDLRSGLLTWNLQEIFEQIRAKAAKPQEHLK